MALFLLIFGPAVASVLIAAGVVAGMIRARHHPPQSEFAWPAVTAATMLPLTIYPLAFTGGYAVSTMGAILLVWTGSALFCIAGLLRPPPPSRRWMYWGGLVEVGLGVLFTLFLTALGQSLGRMH